MIKRVTDTVLILKKLLERFTKRNCKKQTKESLELKEISREKVINYMLNGKVTTNFLIAGLPKPRPFGEKVKVELDLSNHATKVYIKNATGFDTSKFTKKVDLANLKSEIHKLDISKLETTLAGLSKRNGALKNNVVKKTEYHELVKEVNVIKASDTSDLVRQTDCNTKTYEIENKRKLDHDRNNKYITVKLVYSGHAM